jgi:lipopolysaccharide transport system ATP-binding protein
MRPIIETRGISKRYRIGTRASANDTLRDTIVAGVTAPFRRRARAGDSSAATIWALQDVSFDVQPGEIVGIIGHNGAGKSTLLKVLSRITEPTGGRIKLYGRVASLLEVGTGFHPELTGRENVFLNGAILGMRREEIARKFDEIVAFSEMERFLDTPVKHYSSGMYMRLAFAVAAHLEPEILIVDEVLAVGDANFQRKCLDKMENVGRQGRTVLFVSHNMTAITRLCARAILLREGRAFRDGPTQDVIGAYLSLGLGTSPEKRWDDPARSPGNEIVRLRAVRVRDKDGKITDTVDIRQPIGIETEFEVLEAGHVLVPNLPFMNEEGVCIFHVHDSDPEWKSRPRPKGIYSSTVWVPGNFLAEGTVLVGVAVSTLNPVTVHFYERDAVAFQVVDTLEGDSARGDYVGTYPGIVRPIFNWTTLVREGAGREAAGGSR